MSLDDELRRRMQDAADRAGAGLDTSALGANVGAAASAAAPAVPLKLIAGLGLGGLAVGGIIGFTALAPNTEAASQPVVVSAEVQAYSLYDCPDGGLTGAVRAGDRLFAIGRDDGGAWLAVRTPDDPGDVSWLPVSAVAADRDIDLPVVTCNELVTLTAAVGSTTSVVDTTSTTVVTETTTTTTTTAPTNVPTTVSVTTVRPTSTTVRPSQSTVPQPVPPTAPPTVPPTAPPTVPPTVPLTVPPTAPPTVPPDTQQPTIQAGAPSPNEVFEVGPLNCPTTATLTAFAQDNVGVTAVTATWAGLPGSPRPLAPSGGGNWSTSFGPFTGLSNGYNQLITITLTARDAAGNSRNANVQVRVWGNDLCVE